MSGVEGPLFHFCAFLKLSALSQPHAWEYTGRKAGKPFYRHGRKAMPQRTQSKSLLDVSRSAPGF